MCHKTSIILAYNQVPLASNSGHLAKLRSFRKTFEILGENFETLAKIKVLKKQSIFQDFFEKIYSSKTDVWLKKLLGLCYSNHCINTTFEKPILSIHRIRLYPTKRIQQRNLLSAWGQQIEAKSHSTCRQNAWLLMELHRFTQHVHASSFMIMFKETAWWSLTPTLF